MPGEDFDDPLVDFAARAAGMAPRATADRAAAGVIAALRERGIDALIVKGVAIARWLYRPGEARGYVDCDVLVTPADLGRAASTLAALGLVRVHDQGAAPELWTEPHAQTWAGPDWGYVDLHWRLPGLDGDPTEVFGLLWAGREPLELPAGTVPVPAPPARVVHLVTHAAQHGGEGKPRSDLHRALEQVGDDGWRAATALAATLGAGDAFAAGLRVDPRGAELARRLGIGEGSARWRLLASGAESFGAERMLRWSETASRRERARLAWHALFPPRSQMRIFYPAASGGAALARSYVHHAARTPFRAVQAWRAIRRSR